MKYILFNELYYQTVVIFFYYFFHLILYFSFAFRITRLARSSQFSCSFNPVFRIRHYTSLRWFAGRKRRNPFQKCHKVSQYNDNVIR